MNVKPIYVVIICFVLLLVSLYASAAEIYIWIDEEGVKHLTSERPKNPAQMISIERYPDSSLEIRRDEEKQTENQRQRENQLETQQRSNQDKEAGEERLDANKD
jgi:hypothetical protein